LERGDISKAQIGTIRLRYFKSTILFVLLASTVLSAQSVNVPLGHWAYGFIERMEAKGLVSDIKNGPKPFSRKRMAALASQVEASLKANPGLLSRTEAQYFERLKGELWDELQDTGIAVRLSEREPHLYSWKGDAGLFHFDALAGGSAAFRSSGAAKTDRRVYQPYYGAAARGSFWNVGFYSDNRIFSEWGSGRYFQNYDASLGYPRNAEKDSSMATWDMSDSYLMLGVRGFEIEYGRDEVSWGPSPSGGLMFSGLAPSMDMLRIHFDIGPAALTWFHGQVRGGARLKWVSAHRIDFMPAAGVCIGIQDAVVYANRGIEPAYFNPVLPVLVSQHSLGDRDNVEFGVDAAFERIRPVKLYGEFFLDDFTSPWGIFSNDWGNKLAFTAGALWADPARIEDSGLRAEYTRVEPFVYTHRFAENLYEHYNTGLGSDLQPNSDRLLLEWEQWISLSLRAGFQFQSIRHGLGDRKTAHTDEDGESKHFLGGTVETARRFGIRVDVEPVRDLAFRLEAANVRVRNRELVAGAEASWNEVLVKAAWNW
jgi:hypothetical protein